MNVASPRSVARRKRHMAHNLDRFGPRGAWCPTSCMLRSSGLIGYDYNMVQLYVVRWDDERRVPALPYIVREERLQVGIGREYWSSTSRSLPYSAGHVQLPNRVLLLCSPCASRHQVPCNASQVVPGGHRVVDPSTHRGSRPREVHTTSPRVLCIREG
jgi:hypothetical protein